MSTLSSPARSRAATGSRGAVARARLTLVVRRAAGPHRGARGPFVTLVAVVLLVGVVGLLLFNTSMQQASFTATSLERQAASLHARQQSLQLELDSLRDPQRLAVRATGLGMVPMANPAFLRLGQDPRQALAGTEPVPASEADAQRLEPVPARRPAVLRPQPVLVEAPAPLTAPDRGQLPNTGARGVPSDDPAVSTGTKTR